MSINRGGTSLKYYNRVRVLDPEGFEGGHSWLLCPPKVKNKAGTLLRPVVYYIMVQGNLQQGWLTVQDAGVDDPLPHFALIATPNGVNSAFDEPIVGKVGGGLEIQLNGPSRFSLSTGNQMLAVSYTYGYILPESGIDA